LAPPNEDQIKKVLENLERHFLQAQRELKALPGKQEDKSTPKGKVWYALQSKIGITRRLMHPNTKDRPDGFKRLAEGMSELLETKGFEKGETKDFISAELKNSINAELKKLKKWGLYKPKKPEMQAATSTPTGEEESKAMSAKDTQTALQNGSDVQRTSLWKEKDYNLEQFDTASHTAVEAAKVAAAATATAAAEAGKAAEAAAAAQTAKAAEAAEAAATAAAAQTAKAEARLPATPAAETETAAAQTAKAEEDARKKAAAHPTISSSEAQRDNEGAEIKAQPTAKTPEAETIDINIVNQNDALALAFGELLDSHIVREIQREQSVQTVVLHAPKKYLENNDLLVPKVSGYETEAQLYQQIWQGADNYCTEKNVIGFSRPDIAEFAGILAAVNGSIESTDGGPNIRLAESVMQAKDKTQALKDLGEKIIPQEKDLPAGTDRAKLMEQFNKGFLDTMKAKGLQQEKFKDVVKAIEDPKKSESLATSHPSSPRLSSASISDSSASPGPTPPTPSKDGGINRQ